MGEEEAAEVLLLPCQLPAAASLPSWLEPQWPLAFVPRWQETCHRRLERRLLLLPPERPGAPSSSCSALLRGWS